MAMVEFELRRADRSDAADIAMAHRDSIRTIGPKFYPPNVVDDWQADLVPELYLKAMDAGEVFFVAPGTVEGVQALFGFASDYSIEGATHGVSVYVRGISTRRGIGTALLALAERHALANGATTVRVEASLAAVEFYRVNGFTESGRGEAHLMSGRPISCVFMQKSLEVNRGV